MMMMDYLALIAGPQEGKILLHEIIGERTLDLHEKIMKDLRCNCIKMISSVASSSMLDLEPA
jgi:hypothetical protein